MKITVENMNDDNKVELNQELVKQIFELANIPKNSDVTEENLLDAVVKLKSALNPIEDAPFNPTSNNILVIDDIGVVTYQLKILFRNLGYNVQVAKDIFTGLNAFVKSNFAFVIMDLLSFKSINNKIIDIKTPIKKKKKLSLLLCS